MASLHLMYRWSSPYPDEWENAMDNWKRIIMREEIQRYVDKYWH
ncbi:hypothetical protein O5O45_20515 [Hahella aquimaris]|nr:hypothetical protein [Hahella sp. HNIBRBA332]WLQ12112.1 hypothetical protein O5O45_20515 [Hahella sp. HNIBRBA332]